MALRAPGMAPPLTPTELEPLWAKLAIYIERSSTTLHEAWTLDPARVRALLRFRLDPPPIAIVVATANAASFASDGSLLAYAEELREGFDRSGPAEHARTVVECAIERARRRCGAPHREVEAFDRLVVMVKAQGRPGSQEAGEMLLRAGRTEAFPFFDVTVFDDEVFVELVREAGVDVLGELARRSIRLPLRVPLPVTEATRFYPYLASDGYSHQLLRPESRAHEHPVEAARAFTETARASDDVFGSKARVAAVLALASSTSGTGAAARVVGTLREDPIWLVNEALHFPRVRELMSSHAPSLVYAKSSRAARAVVESTRVFALDDRAADAQIGAALGAIVDDPPYRLLGLLALFRIAMARGRHVAASRVAAKIPAANRPNAWMELARAYAEAGDFAGVVELISKVDSVNYRRPHQTSPLALAVLRALRAASA